MGCANNRSNRLLLLLSQASKGSKQLIARAKATYDAANAAAKVHHPTVP
jgi:hypothetical protein|eukprot:COSAG06_NODE_3342_length_5481_cov_2.258826_3_plen_49_part_00